MRLKGERSDHSTKVLQCSAVQAEQLSEVQRKPSSGPTPRPQVVGGSASVAGADQGSGGGGSRAAATADDRSRMGPPSLAPSLQRSALRCRLVVGGAAHRLGAESPPIGATAPLPIP